MAATMPALLHAAGDFFATPDGQAVYLAGVHTWTNLQQIGSTPFDYGAYLALLNSEGANLIRLWTWGAGTDGGTIYGPVDPLPWVRMADGRYDLTQFNAAYFSNLQSRVQQAGANGDYVEVMLFDGWSVNAHGSANNPWLSNPFNAANNVNGIDGDPGRTGVGDYSFTLADPAVLAAQEAYVAKVIQTVGNDSNVIFEVANEAPDTSPAAVAWQNAIVDFIHSYEASNGFLAHPVGITGSWSEQGLTSADINAILHQTHADWISPTENGYWGTSTPAPGDKPVIVDTDHVYGIGGDAGWVWEQFTDGNSVLSMDNLDGTGIAGTIPGAQLSSDLIAQEISVRLGVQETRQVAGLLNLTSMATSGGLSSTGFALANPSAGEYVVYAPGGGTFTVNLSGSAGETLGVRWMDIGSGQLSGGGTVQGGSSGQAFTSPSGSAALILTPQSTPAPAPAQAVPSASEPAEPDDSTSGSGSDTLTVRLAEDAYAGDAQANVSLDGKLLTPTPITVTALQSAGQTQNFTFLGDFGTGDHSIVVTFLQDAWGSAPGEDRNLYVDGVSLDGKDASSGVGHYAWGSYTVADPVPVYGTGDTASFSLPGGTNASPPVSSTSSSGGDTLTVALAEDAYDGDAQASISIDGTKLTATPVTVTALRSGGQTQDFTFKGDFGQGVHDVAVNFLNDAYGGSPSLDRNLYVEKVSLNGTIASSGTAHYDGNTVAAAGPIELYTASNSASFLVSSS